MPLYGQDVLFQTIRDSIHNLPHIFVTGPPGCGKTTFLELYIELCKKEAPFKVESVLWLSSEKDRGIHTIRDKINDFCKRAHSIPNSLRFVIIDDADSLPLISQQALRRPMEQYSHLTRFIFASRCSSNLIEPLKSRCLTLEIEPVCLQDLFPFFLKEIHLDIEEPNYSEVFTFCINHFININEVKILLKLYKFFLKTNSHSETLEKIKSLLPVSSSYISRLIHALATKNEKEIRFCITQLFLNGYLLDDILLGVEKGAYIFPSVDPVARFTLLQFTMLGWISIQQGKEHWLDTMDIVSNILN